MYSTSEALTNAIINGEPINKELRLLGGDGVVIKTIKSLKLYSGSNSTSRIQIGSTNSSYIEASIEYDKVLANREMALYCGIDSEMIPMGIYKIMQEPSEDDGIISFKAYDRMRLLDKLYEPTVVIPNSFKNVVDDIAKQCGVTVNFSYTGGTVRNYIKGYTCREMIGYIASMMGMFAYFDRQGVLNFGWYAWGKPVEKTLSSFWSLKKNNSDYKVTGVEFIANSDTKYLAGSEPNIIYCSNPFADRGDAENVYYGPMRDLTYRPAEISMLDDIRLDVTDVVKVTLLDGTTIEEPCMTLNQDFTASETKVKAVGNADGEASNYSGPLTTAMDRMTTDLLLTNRVVATKVDADWVRANTVTVDKITAIQAEIDEINANNITTDNLSANVAKLGYLTADEAEIKYANIKLTNIETANVATLFANVGLIDRATISEGHITGYLDSVEVNASKITAGTLVADRILLKGSEKGLLYALNNLGELTSTTVDSLDGYVLTDRTINADKIVASSITANELDVANIFADNAVISTITSQSAFINAISTNSVVVGIKNTVDNLQIGGRNLIKGTHKTAVTYSYPTSRYVDFDAITTTPLNGDTYTLSFWAKSTVDGDIITTYFYNPNNVTSLNGSQGQHSTAIDGRCEFTLSTVLTKYWVTYTIRKNSNSTKNVIIPRLFSGDGTGEVTVQWEKLEEGNKATDWSPAPEDISVENIYSPNTTTIDGGKITTGSITADKISVDDLNALTATIGSWNITTNKIYAGDDKLGTAVMQIPATDTRWVFAAGGKSHKNYGDCPFRVDKEGNLYSTSGTIGGWTITDKLSAKGQNYLPPTEADFNKIRNAAQNGTIASLYAENIWWDLDGNGKTDIYDFGIFRQIMLGKREYSSVNHKKLSDVTIEINPASTDKAIRIYGTNAWGSLVDTYIGSVSSNIDNLSVTGLNCSHGLAIGSNDVWTEEQGLKAQGDIIAGLGTSNQVSLQSMPEVRRGTLTSTSASGAWGWTHVTFSTPFTKSVPTVVTQDMSLAGAQIASIVINVTKAGFDFGVYNISNRRDFSYLAMAT